MFDHWYQNVGRLSTSFQGLFDIITSVQMALTATSFVPTKLLKRGQAAEHEGVVYRDVVLGATVVGTSGTVMIKGSIEKDDEAQNVKFRNEIDITALLATLGPKEGGYNFPRYYGEFSCRAPAFDEKAAVPALCDPDGPRQIHYFVTEQLPVTYNAYVAQLNAEQKVVLHSTMFQQLSCALQCAYDKYVFVHNDLNTSNIMIKPTDLAAAEYVIRGKVRSVETHGMLIVIIDFGESTVYIPWLDMLLLHDSIYRDVAEVPDAGFFKLYAPEDPAEMPRLNVQLDKLLDYQADPAGYLGKPM